jgi:hypothetical protein
VIGGKRRLRLILGRSKYKDRKCWLVFWIGRLLVGDLEGLETGDWRLETGVSREWSDSEEADFVAGWQAGTILGGKSEHNACRPSQIRSRTVGEVVEVYWVLGLGSWVLGLVYWVLSIGW